MMYFPTLNYGPTDSQVTANPELRGLVVEGGHVLPTSVVEDAFRAQHGKTLNIQQFRQGLARLDQWYQDKGFFGSVRVCRNVAVCGQRLPHWSIRWSMWTCSKAWWASPSLKQSCSA